MKTVINPIVLTIVFALSPTLAFSESIDTGESFADELRTGGMGPKVVVIPGGRFTLGGGAPGQHDLGVVKFDYRIAVGATEVTVGQYRQFLEATQSGNLDKFGGMDENLPVSGVSWDEAEAYLTWLSRASGHHYRLPSASEWEYAARAGKSTLYSWGDDLEDERANCLECTRKFAGEHAPVGSFPPNDWGLYDMHGNVWEWTKDCIDANSRPPANGMPQLFGNCQSRELRGGSAKSDGWSIRAGARATALRETRLPDVGFRVVRELDLAEE